MENGISSTYIAHHVLNVNGITKPKSVLNDHIRAIGTPTISVMMNAMHASNNIVLICSPLPSLQTNQSQQILNLMLQCHVLHTYDM